MVGIYEPPISQIVAGLLVLVGELYETGILAAIIRSGEA